MTSCSRCLRLLIEFSISELTMKKHKSRVGSDFSKDIKLAGIKFGKISFSDPAFFALSIML